MLTFDTLQELAKRYQTSERNVIREYIQHLCLSTLYKIRQSEHLLFKGGTALKIIYQNPRFSEGLDFTGYFSRFGEIEELFLMALTEIEKVGIKIDFKDSKSTTGGYLGIIHYHLFGSRAEMKFEVSLRRSLPGGADLTTIISDFMPPYTLFHLSAKDLVYEKIQALINRGKPRDYYDLYFLLRHPVLNKFVDKHNLRSVLEKLNQEHIDFRRELSVLLPVSHHMVLKNFKEMLRKEINRYM